MYNRGNTGTPFLKIILPAALGILTSRLIDIPLWTAVACFGVVVCYAVIARRQRITDLYVWFSVAFFFFAVAEARTPRSLLPAGERIIVVAQVRESPDVRGRWQHTTADVGYYRLADNPEAGWTRASERIRLSVDTSYKEIGVGTQLAVRGWYNPIDTTGSGYGDLMRLRGIHGRIYLVPGNLLGRSAHVSRTPAYFASRMQAAAIERLSRLDVDSARLSVVTAMVAGDKRSVEHDLRQEYASSGSAHLLAVSGLHVGIVFVLINLLLYLLPVFRHGHIAKNAGAVAAIWLYAMMAGLSPSVVRAALMFSFAQIALATNSYRDALNIMLGSAVVMLAVNPNYAADPSFLMSYSAVLAILVFFKPIFTLVKTRYKLVNALLSVIIVGVVATAGTAPLVSYWFGNIPVAGIIINPVVILTAHAIVMLGVLWVVMPFGFLAPLFSWALSAVVGVQNAVVGWCASLGWAYVGVRMPLWAVVAVYAVYTVVAVWLYGRENRKEPQQFDV